MPIRTYLSLFLVLATLGFCGIAAVNYLVDPYRFFDSPDRPGINKYRQRFFLGQYISKPYALREQAPEGVILGVSRAGSSMGTDHPGWAVDGVYNYGMAGSTAYLLWRNYQHAKASGDLKRVLLMLDFYMFNFYDDQRPAASYVSGYEERLAVSGDFGRNYAYGIRLFKDTLNALLSFEMLFESLQTIRAQQRIAGRELYKATLTPTGFWINDPAPDKTQRRLFHIIEQQYMTTTWFPMPARKFALSGNTGNSHLHYLRRILADAHQSGIDLRLAFMPFHARLAEAMYAVNLWTDFEQWKRDVVSVIEKEAGSAGEKPFPIWDFTGYNRITTEPVPLKTDIATRMRWHLDATHVNRAAGYLIQTIMLETPGERYDDFGKRVDSGNIEAYIRRTRADRERYRVEFPDDVLEVRERAKKTAAWRQQARPGG